MDKRPTHPNEEERARIAELRKRIAANKGIARRAWETAAFLREKAARANYEIRCDQTEIERLGGRVRR